MDEQQQVLGEQRLDHELGIVDREVDDGRVELAATARSGRASVVLPSWTIGWTSGWSRRDGAEQLRHQPAGGGADHPDAGLAGDVGVERGHVGGDVVDLVQDPPGPLDDPRALLGEPAVGAVDEA